MWSLFHKTIIRLLLGCLLVCYLVLPFESHAANHQPHANIGINADMPPFSFYDQKVQKYRGFCVDLARLIAGGMQRPVRFTPLGDEQLKIALSNGEVDFICGYIDLSRDTQLFHTIETSFRLEKRFFVNKSCLTVACAKDLDNQVVVISKGQNLERFVDSRNLPQFIETDDQETALSMVSSGSAKAFISHNALSTSYLIQDKKIENIKQVGIALEETPLSMIARKTDADLISKLSFAYGKLVESGQYQTLMDKWFGKSFAANFWDRYGLYLTSIFSGTVLVLIFFVIWHQSLRRRVVKITKDLKYSEKRYRKLIESSPDMITMADKDGDIILANRRAQELLGYPHEEITSQNMVDLVAETYRIKMKELISDVGESGFANGSFKVDTRNTIYLEIVATTMQYESSDREMICFFCRDITPRKRLEEELIQSERLAVMGQMAAGLAHEINNPLGIILANTEEILNEGPNPIEAKESLQAIERNAVRAAKIIENLLSFTRPGFSIKSQVDVVELVEEAIFFLRQTLKQANVQVNTKYENPSIMINADENQFQQLVINLMLNSIEAMPEEGGIIEAEVKIDPSGASPILVMDIIDDGVGIPEEELDKVFNPFFSARKHQGFGLGLFICKGIVEKHQGTIEAISRQGRGTTIRVTLPFEQEKGATEVNHG